MSRRGENPTRCPRRPHRSPFKTIRFALRCAKDGDTIKVGAGTFGRGINITKSVTIAGSSSGTTTIDARNLRRAVTVAPDATVVISNVTVRNGKDPDGAGISSSGTFSLSNAHVAANDGIGILIAGGSTTLTGVTVDGSTAEGVVIRGAVVASDLHVASNASHGIVIDTGRLSLSNAHVAANDGIGILIAAGSTTLTGVTVDGSTAEGVVIRGAAAASDLHVASNASHGIVIDTAKLVTLAAFESHDNGGSGVFVRRAAGPEAQILGERTTTDVSSTIIERNTSDGVTIGESAAQSDIHVLVQDADVRYNQGNGVTVQDEGAAAYAPRLNGLNVWFNGGHGLVLLTPIPPAVGYSITDQYSDPPSTPGGDPWLEASNTCCNNPTKAYDPPSFSGNRFHSNLLNQVVFDGLQPDTPAHPTKDFYVDSPNGGCNIGANEAYSYRNRPGQPDTVAIYAMNGARVFVNHFGFTGGAPNTNDFRYDVTSNMRAVNPCTAPPISP